jgi:hypothetical protein
MKIIGSIHPYKISPSYFCGACTEQLWISLTCLVYPCSILPNHHEVVQVNAFNIVQYVPHNIGFCTTLPPRFMGCPAKKPISVMDSIVLSLHPHTCNSTYLLYTNNEPSMDVFSCIIENEIWLCHSSFVPVLHAIFFFCTFNTHKKFYYNV